MKNPTEYFEPQKKRKPAAQKKLDSIEHLRKGYMKVTVDGLPGRCIPIMVTSCYTCGEPAPIIADGRFVCRKCVLIFPKFKEKHYKGVKYVSEKQSS